MSGIKLVKRYEIEVLTPVHIGSGEVLQRDIDYVERERRTYFIDREGVFSRIPLDRLKGISSTEELRKIFNEIFDREGVEKFSVFSSETIPKREVRECIKDPFGNPYIPGSSLKGAIRTVILKNLASNDMKKSSEVFHRIEERGRTKNPGRILEEEFLRIKEVKRVRGKEKLFSGPHYDVGRTMIVRDALFKKQDLELYLVKVFSKKGELEDLVIFSIGLRPGSRAEAEILIDRFLLEKKFQVYRSSIENLEEEIRKFSLGWIEREKDRLRSLMRQAKEAEFAFESVLGFYEDFTQRLQKGEILLHVGYGIGWRGTTGDILELAGSSTREKILSRLRISYDKDFPTSRRFVELEERTFAPMGWIKLTLKGGGEA